MTTENIRGVQKEEAALLRLVNLCFDTETGIEELTGKDKLAELTDIPRRMVNHLAIQMMREVALNPRRLELGIPLSKCWRVFFFQLMRSVGRKHLLTGIGLAESEIASQAPEEGEPWEM